MNSSETKSREMESGPEEAPQTSATSFKCPSCGGVMVFDPKGQSLRCEYCKNVINLEDDKQDPTAYGFDSDNELEHQVWVKEAMRSSVKAVVHKRSLMHTLLLTGAPSAATVTYRRK